MNPQPGDQTGTDNFRDIEALSFSTFLFLFLILRIELPCEGGFCQDSVFPQKQILTSKATVGHSFISAFYVVHEAREFSEPAVWHIPTKQFRYVCKGSKGCNADQCFISVVRFILAVCSILCVSVPGFLDEEFSGVEYGLCVRKVFHKWSRHAGFDLFSWWPEQKGWHYGLIQVGYPCCAYSTDGRRICIEHVGQQLLG